MSEKTALQMTVKSLNNTASADGLVITFLLFRAYLCMESIDPPVSMNIKWTTSIQNIIEQARKIWAENQVIDGFSTRNEQFVNFFQDLPVNYNVLVPRKNNEIRTGK